MAFCDKRAFWSTKVPYAQQFVPNGAQHTLKTRRRAARFVRNVVKKRRDFHRVFYRCGKLCQSLLEGGRDRAIHAISFTKQSARQDASSALHTGDYPPICQAATAERRWPTGPVRGNGCDARCSQATRADYTKGQNRQTRKWQARILAFGDKPVSSQISFTENRTTRPIFPNPLCQFLVAHIDLCYTSPAL